VSRRKFDPADLPEPWVTLWFRWGPGRVVAEFDRWARDRPQDSRIRMAWAGWQGWGYEIRPALGDEE
jgi:hypothetical protein